MKSLEKLYTIYMDKLIRNLIIIFVVIVIICSTIIGIFLYLYPLKHKGPIIHITFKYGIEPEVVASIINAESRFNEKSVSKAGAIGLMQLLPSTAKEVAKKENITYFDGILYNPYYNIYLGTAYFKMLLDRFKDFDTAICAYNAGPNRVKLWLDNPKFSVNGVKLANTPFPETNYYLSKIKKNIKIYSKLF